jgi:hypothetical protein
MLPVLTLASVAAGRWVVRQVMGSSKPFLSHFEFYCFFQSWLGTLTHKRAKRNKNETKKLLERLLVY